MKSDGDERWRRWLRVFLVAAPVAIFFVVLTWPVRLAPLEGMESLCAKCDRKATRTLKSAADAMREKGIYLYDRQRYPKAAPVWCDNHGPLAIEENAGWAFGIGLGVLLVCVFVYTKFT